VSDLLSGLLGILLATNPPMAASNLVMKKTGIALAVANPNDPVEKEYLKLLEDDDAAQEEVDKWIREHDEFQDKGAGISEVTLQLRIEQRLEPIIKRYEYFLERNPKHARARLAYGSFLGDTGKDFEAAEQWEKARELDPKNPAVWNNLANHYGHRGPVKRAFEYYTKAIELDPNEAVYFQNFATTVYLFRVDAKEYFQADEPKVFDLALELYRKALKLDPDNFALAQDLAQSYYGIKPLRADDALAAWNYTLKIAKDDVQREGVYVHLARVQLNSGQFEDARRNLKLVTNDVYQVLKSRLTKNLEEKEQKAKGTNAPPLTVEKK
jgi:tetratricopeptide (TPR) repeat protein